MRHLIVNTLPRNEAEETINELLTKTNVFEIIHTENLKVHGCVGCNDCWLKTPGICSIRDDYEQIFIKFLQSDRVIFITNIKLGFVSYKMKNLLDRIMPMVTMYLKFDNGQMRHYNRYKKRLDMGLIYSGDADSDFLNTWMERMTLNFHSKSLGAYEISNRKELYDALSNN